MVDRIKSATQQSSNHIVLVRPNIFFSNPETCIDNFAQASGEGLSDRVQQAIAQKADKEFFAIKENLEKFGVQVTVYDGPEGCPDAIFPNNTISTHTDIDENGYEVSTVVFYPMKAKNRQAELTAERQAEFASQYDNVIDLRGRHDLGQILEGTGSLVLDRINKIAYACRSERTNDDLVHEWADSLGYKAVLFDMLDGNDKVVYHTNVAMWVGTEAAGICLEGIHDEKQRELVRKTLQDSGKQVIEITKEQMDAPNFCGNALEVLNGQGDPMLSLSQAAWDAYTDEQRQHLERLYPAGVIKHNIPTIEEYGGGSVRCTHFEVFNKASGVERSSLLTAGLKPAKAEQMITF